MRRLHIQLLLLRWIVAILSNYQHRMANGCPSPRLINPAQQSKNSVPFQLLRRPGLDIARDGRGHLVPRLAF